MPMGVTSKYSFGEVERIVTEAYSRQVLFKEPSFRSLLFDRLESLMPSERSVLSLDIFDTLVLRDNSSELERFIEFGEAMARVIGTDKLEMVCASATKTAAHPSRGAMDAFFARYMGMKASYRARDRVRGYGEGSLTEIHLVASRLLTNSVDFKNTFIDAELECEATHIHANTLLLEYADMHIARGGKVILVTDMYMHATQVKRLLGLVGIDTNKFTAIISSADECISKASGLIFPKIETQMKLSAGNFIHVGDSLKGDFQKPVSQGWRALHLPISTAEIGERRKSHTSAAEMLKDKFSIEVDIAMPS